MAPTAATQPPLPLTTPKDPLTAQQNLQLIGVTLLSVLVLVGLLFALRMAHSARARSRLLRRAAAARRKTANKSAWVESGRRARLADPASS
ncbi:MAG: hypothetical protein H7Y88_02560 [Phycisphaerales bacterium]|nr:hypothetical protein [Phycisphaerales bacterium]